MPYTLDAGEPDAAPASLWVGVLWGFIFSVVLFWGPLVLTLLAIGGAS